MSVLDGRAHGLLRNIIPMFSAFFFLPFSLSLSPSCCCNPSSNHIRSRPPRRPVASTCAALTPPWRWESLAAGVGRGRRCPKAPAPGQPVRDWLVVVFSTSTTCIYRENECSCHQSNPKTDVLRFFSLAPCEVTRIFILYCCILQFLFFFMAISRWTVKERDTTEYSSREYRRSVRKAFFSLNYLSLSLSRALEGRGHQWQRTSLVFCTKYYYLLFIINGVLLFLFTTAVLIIYSGMRMVLQQHHLKTIRVWCTAVLPAAHKYLQYLSNHVGFCPWCLCVPFFDTCWCWHWLVGRNETSVWYLLVGCIGIASRMYHTTCVPSYHTICIRSYGTKAWWRVCRWLFIWQSILGGGFVLKGIVISGGIRWEEKWVFIGLPTALPLWPRFVCPSLVSLLSYVSYHRHSTSASQGFFYRHLLIYRCASLLTFICTSTRNCCIWSVCVCVVFALKYRTRISCM